MDPGQPNAAALVVSSSPPVREDAERWCAALGAEAVLADDVVQARRSWREARLVIVGADVARSVAGAGLSRRDHVVVVHEGHDEQEAWPAAVALGAVAVVSVREERAALAALTAALDGRGEGAVVSVLGAVGGSGTSTFAGCLAGRAVHRGHRSLLADLDPLGGGLDLLLGAEHAEGVRWQGLGGADGTLSAGSLSKVLPTAEGMAVLTWDRDHPVARPSQVGGIVSAAVRGFDLVVADLPRRPDEHVEDVLGRSVLTVLLVPEETRALAAARATLAWLETTAGSVAVLGVARPGGIESGLLARALERPVVGRLRRDRSMRTAVEVGRGPLRARRTARTADAVLDLLGLEAVAA
ncbi:septum formation initiator [Aeromicrobium halocynthiae]|uniref:Septum formation initiator n=1 Tax=Aeromicrobium halocynthiae TaxID=560557 RepID=A0ABN2W1Z1_9ACTN